MKITRIFTTSGSDPFDSVKWVKRSSRIVNPDGSVVFEMTDAEVPEGWSQLATDIMVSKYFRKAGVPQTDGETGPERSARQVIHRLAGCWRHWGQTHGYFDTADDGQAFEDELKYMMVHQMSAPNSPQWFNTGLNWAYGISGPAQGHFIADPATGVVTQATDAYSHPQPHACFIQSVKDDLVNPGGIMDLWVREARLFKYGSGTGTNFSSLRGENEPLSGGGQSSGLMSWLKIGDRAAGAIKSGGTTRRAAKMVCLDLDHPDIEKFVNWKVREEIKVAALVEGMKHLSDEQRETAERLGLSLTYDFNGEAYLTVSGQNSNNSIRIADSFFEALDADKDWPLLDRVTGAVAKTVKASDLWDQVSFAAWRCADPGVQYDTTINAWHTCPASGRINASNPCSEYMFLDNTACNLASINLLKFYDEESRTFDIERFEHAIDLWTTALEISVLMAAFPSEEIAKLSWEYRTLGLGYANLGAVLMRAGIAYDSPEARAFAGAVSAVLTGRAYRQSALMAAEMGPFAGFKENADHMLRVIRNHARAARGVSRHATGVDAYEELPIAPVPIDHATIRSDRVNIANAGAVLDHAVTAWDDALSLGQKHGYRNAQVTVIAPTGTIGLLMDCDTTGVEPDFALVKFKKLAGGGYFKIANASLRPALETLGYHNEDIRKILTYVLGTLKLDVPMSEPGADTFTEYLLAKGLTREDLDRVEDALPGVFELSFAFNVWMLGDDATRRLGFDPDELKSSSSFNMLQAIGLTAAQVEALNAVICGSQTIEGAPGLKDEHLPIFDCASTCGKNGTRLIAVEGHIRMMASAQPFISGAISKTINLHHDATVDDIKSAYRLSWELGLKANALYRDGSKLSQPLSSKSDTETDGGGDDQARRGLDESAVLVLTQRAVEAEEKLAKITQQFEEAQRRLTKGVSQGSTEDSSQSPSNVAEVRIVHRPMRKRLPDTRRSITHKFCVSDHEGYLTVGLYEDGRPGELFITMAKEGSTVGGLMDSLGTAVSVALQYGVPIESLVNKFTHQRFEPSGMTMNRDIPMAKSLVDYIFRWIGIEFVEGYREVAVPKRSSDSGDLYGGPTVAFSKGSRYGVDSDSGTGNGTSNGNGDLPVQPVSAPGIAAGGASDLHGRPSVDEPGASPVTEIERRVSSVLSSALRDCQGDAPACDVCGTITIRNGTCYKCLNCGHSMGCS